MIADLRTYTMVPGRLGASLKLYQSDGMPIHLRHLGKPVGAFTTEVGTLNQVVFVWAFQDQAGRERRRNALENDPDRAAYRKKSGEAGNVQHKENKIMRSKEFSPL
jgi:NIPSNAP